MQKLWNRFLALLDDWLFSILSRIRIRGFRGAPLYPILKMLKQDMTNRSFVLNSSAMAYAFFLSIFPTIIFVFSLLPYLPSEGFEQGLEQSLARFLPEQAFQLVAGTFDRTVHEASMYRLILSLAVVLFLGIRGVTAMANAFNSMDPLHTKDRNIIQTTLIGAYMYLVVLLLAGVAVFVWVMGQGLLNDAKDMSGWQGDALYYLYLVLFRALLLFVLLLTLNFIYRTAPTYRYRWKTFSPGSIVAAVLLLIAILLLNVYFSQFSNYNKIYGSLGAVIVMLVWFYWLSFVLQIGFHLNSNIQELYEEHKQQKERRSAMKRGPQKDRTGRESGSWYTNSRRR